MRGPSMPRLDHYFSTDAANPRYAERALADLRDGLSQWRLALALAQLDLRNRYRGSVLGPLWMTLSSLIMLIGLGLLYGALFKLKLSEYLPHLAVSLIVWQWMAGFINDSCTTLISAEGMIRQMRLPYTLHALRVAFRNSFVAAHSLPLIPIIFLIFGQLPGPEALLAIPGLVLICINMLAGGLLLGMICARFRDIPSIVTNALQLAFFLTPIIWKLELLGDAMVWMALNPFYALIETVRGPLLEGGGPPLAWLAAIFYTAVNVVLAGVLFTRFRSRIAFWV
ncbi:MAG: ABC transporter permease [Alphaproteobacteria bacterium]|nr:ABC transporter permease [Alphaproteobacteria bacterium]